MSAKNHFFLKELFEKYRLDLQRFLASKFGEADSEDIAQEAFINLMNLDDCDDIQNPKAYLYQTARNLALSRIRRTGLHKNYTDSLVAEDSFESVSLERSFEAEQDLRKVGIALADFPEKYRRTFVLSRVHGLSYTEISAQLDMPVSTVEKHIIKTLKFLRKNLEG